MQGLGTTWCVCPKKIWKHFGNENDDELITRRKCISLIMGSLLAILLLAVVVGLIVGISKCRCHQPKLFFVFIIKIHVLNLKSNNDVDCSFHRVEDMVESYRLSSSIGGSAVQEKA